MKLAQIHALLDQIQGMSFAGMDTITEVKLKGGKKNPHLGRVTKHTTGNHVMLFTNKKSNAYEAMVKRRLEAEGKDPKSFTLGQLAWGTRVPDSPLIEHKGKFYIQTIFIKGGSSEFFLDNKPIAKSDIQGFEEQEVTSGRQGLEDENTVVVRTFALDSIREIRLMGETVKG